MGKKQILLDKLTEYNKAVNDMSKFKLNTKEENLFCDIMQKYAEEYHSEQLRQYNVVGRSEQLLAFLEWYDSNVCQNDCRSRDELVKDFISQ